VSAPQEPALSTWPVRDLARLRTWEIGFGLFCIAASLTNLLTLETRVEEVPAEVRWWTFALFIGFAALPVAVLVGWRAARIAAHVVSRAVR
jgi:hypothetical protein